MGGEKKVKVVVKVNTKPTDKIISACQDSDNCMISYTYHFSPLLYSIYPRATTPGENVQFEGHFRLAFTVDDNAIQLEDIRFGLFFCDRFNLPELEWDNINSW